ncbi:transglycosylase domain-containing protein [Streptomyces sp. PT12]|uniref:transglycosylase domain-containing protein n=1 Tax=Streptomyces sp. PT12 TaxID=1510197 RepID=UPI000DE2AF32|nr:transglycosylase domain-containing protein [Streptomyces sp. PT12]RBM05561.1 penicillin-binding protein [Streptomyces sp. PT12]
MSEHRRKQPQSRGRRAAGPSGRRAAPPPVPPAGTEDPPGATQERPYGSRAEARRAAQRGGRRRAASASAAADGGGRAARRRRDTTAGKRRFIDYPRSGYRGMRRWLPSWRQMLGSVLTFFALMLGLVGLAYAMTEIPDQADIANQQSNVFYWANGERMVVSGESRVNRQPLELADIPMEMQNSVIAAENETFYNDPGIDLMGIGRAVLNMARGGETQSGSTITQQYVKNMYLTQEQTLERKARELLLSVKVGAQVDKEEILEGYLNTSDFGRGAIGIQAAAQAYYGKDAGELTDSECAFLTTLLNGPALHDPFQGGSGEVDVVTEENVQRATERWEYVLNRRVETGTLAPDAHEAIIAEGFPTPNPPTPAMEMAGQIGYLTNLAEAYVINQGILTEEELAKGGYQIHTTFDETMVNQMETAVADVIEANIDPEERAEDRHVQFGGAAVVPGDGAIRAIYGGTDFTEHFLNNADNPRAQVGSTFKPFVLAAALRDGIRDPEGDAEQDREERTQLSPESVYHSENGQRINNYNGEPVVIEEEGSGEEGEWHQENFLQRDHGDITLREAMEVSANVPFVQLGMDVGPATVAQAAMDAGLHEDSLGPANDTVPAFALGVSTPGPIRMASAYATFAAGGEQAEPYSVTRVEGPKENLPWEHENTTTQAFESSVADTVTDVLTGVVEGDEGSGRDAQVLERPVAGKTGTTDDNKSAWFVGYTPQLSTAIGMWRSADSEEELVGDEEMGFLSMFNTAGSERINGSSLPLEAWIAFMQAALEGEPVEEFPDPPSSLGETIWGGGAESPPPPPVETEEPEAPETEEPTEEPTESSPPPSEDPTDDPTDPCLPLDPLCEDPGGQNGDPQGGDTDPGNPQGTTGEPGDPEGSDGEQGDPEGDTGWAF